jgi:hypothetical protein
VTSDSVQLTTLLHRLGQIAVWANPATALGEAARIAAQAIAVCATEPAGDPDQLDQVAAAFQAAAGRLGGVERQLRAVSATALPDVWRGLAGGTAQTAVAALGSGVGAAPPAFAGVHGTLRALAEAIRAARAKHRDGRARLRGAYDRLAHPTLRVLGLSVPEPVSDPAQVLRAVEDAAAGLRLCQEAYAIAEDAGRHAASRLRDAAGKARVGAIATGDRFSPLDAASLADQAFGADRPPAFDTGVLTAAQVRRASQTLAGMPAGDYAGVRRLLTAAGSDTERAYLLKALAAGHPLADVDRFAAQIRGRPDSWLDAHLSLLRPGGDQPLSYADGSGARIRIDQYDATTCASMSVLAVRSMADPIFTLGLTTGGPGGSDSAAEVDRRLSAEQQRIHDESTHRALGPLDYPQAIGTPPWGVADQLNRYATATGTRYGSRLVDSADAAQIDTALSDVERAVDAGHPVPVLVGDAVPKHYVLVVGHEGGSLQVYEPTGGETVTVSETDFRTGSPAFARALGFPHVQAVVVPRS